ncbi:MAG: BcpO-related WXXGXW repeat protein [Chlorobiaceae bacterium]|jgi:hypothetical protein|nr:BcpO-related WXXGXW repeat protein [Chlorobiaceae bacterium]NTV17447.1 BcpO-related WXXGXW repeat protein [Chlorobiaceae bacterium]
MKKNIWLVAGIVGVLFGSFPLNSQEGFSMSSRRGGGVSIVIGSQPNFIDLPDQGFSVSVGSPYDIINYDNRYYIYQDGSWYNSRDYRGPWVVIRENRLPDRIRRHRPEDIRRYRDAESQRRGSFNHQNQRNDDNRR